MFLKSFWNQILLKYVDHISIVSKVRDTELEFDINIPHFYGMHLLHNHFPSMLIRVLTSTYTVGHIGGWLINSINSGDMNDGSMSKIYNNNNNYNDSNNSYNSNNNYYKKTITVTTTKVTTTTTTV